MWWGLGVEVEERSMGWSSQVKQLKLETSMRVETVMAGGARSMRCWVRERERFSMSAGWMRSLRSSPMKAPRRRSWGRLKARPKLAHSLESSIQAAGMANGAGGCFWAVDAGAMGLKAIWVERLKKAKWRAESWMLTPSIWSKVMVKEERRSMMAGTKASLERAQAEESWVPKADQMEEARSLWAAWGSLESAHGFWRRERRKSAGSSMEPSMAPSLDMYSERPPPEGFGAKRERARQSLPKAQIWS